MKNNNKLDIRIKEIENKMETLEFELTILKSQRDGKRFKLYGGLDKFLNIKEEDLVEMQRNI